MIEKKPTPLPERITLKGVKEAGGEETPRFEAKLCLDGKVVAHVSNGGTGGCNNTYWERGIHAHAEKVCEDLAQAWYEAENPGEKGFEVLDSLVYALMDHASHQRRGKANAKKGFPITVMFDDPKQGHLIVGYRTKKAMLEALTEQGVDTYELVYEAGEGEAKSLLLETRRKEFAKKGAPVMYEITFPTGRVDYHGLKVPATPLQITNICVQNNLHSMIRV